MTKSAFEIIDNGLEMSLKQVLKISERAEKSALKAGANVMKKSVKDKLIATGVKVMQRNPKYNDRLIDAVRVTKPRNGMIKVHILGTRKSKSGTYRLRFFESPKNRYNKKRHGTPLRTPRDVGSLSKYNGFFAAGVNASIPEVERKMDEAIAKYIEKAWNG